MLSCDLPEAPPELGLLNVDNLGGMSLSAAVLTYHPAGEPLRYPEHGGQVLNSPAAAFRTQKFPSSNFYGIAGPADGAMTSPSRLPPEAS